MRIDESILHQARTADVLVFLEKYNGFTFTHQRGEYRCKQHPSLAVKDNRLSWYWHSKSVGGFGSLDYLTKIENMPFREAVGVVQSCVRITESTPHTEPIKPKTLVLPEKTVIPLRLYDYLCCKRGIDSDIINTLIQKDMLYEDKRGNIVFVGYDENDKARFASLRGTHGDFRMDCAGSDKRYGFNISCPQSERLYIFESAIDLLSCATLEKSASTDKTAWCKDNRLSLAGTSDTAIPFFLNKHNLIKEMVFCLDNDPAGREASVSMARKYADKGFYTRLELPTKKDFNEDLTEKIRLEKAQKISVKIHKDLDD